MELRNQGHHANTESSAVLQELSMGYLLEGERRAGEGCDSIEDRGLDRKKKHCFLSQGHKNTLSFQRMGINDRGSSLLAELLFSYVFLLRLFSIPSLPGL